MVLFRGTSPSVLLMAKLMKGMATDCCYHRHGRWDLHLQREHDADCVAKNDMSMANDLAKTTDQRLTRFKRFYDWWDQVVRADLAIFFAKWAR